MRTDTFSSSRTCRVRASTGVGLSRSRSNSDRDFAATVPRRHVALTCSRSVPTLLLFSLCPRDARDLAASRRSTPSAGLCPHVWEATFSRTTRAARNVAAGVHHAEPLYDSCRGPSGPPGPRDAFKLPGSAPLSYLVGPREYSSGERLVHLPLAFAAQHAPLSCEITPHGSLANRKVRKGGTRGAVQRPQQSVRFAIR